MQLPVVLIIPHMSSDRVLCDFFFDFPYTLLGLGDVLIPGLSTNYAIIFDTANANRYYPYFVINFVGYVVGLFLAFIGLMIMNTAQPALFYLCPILLMVSMATAMLRREFKSYWSGQPVSFESSPRPCSLFFISFEVYDVLWFVFRSTN